jgi:hypothetical protein
MLSSEWLESLLPLKLVMPNLGRPPGRFPLRAIASNKPVWEPRRPSESSLRVAWWALKSVFGGYWWSEWLMVIFVRD